CFYPLLMGHQWSGLHLYQETSSRLSCPQKYRTYRTLPYNPFLYKACGLYGILFWYGISVQKLNCKL
ncbi:hypothetical protein, partial [Phascolarctobacterium succinatutens]|uniref:hypothetical protein n=1 Tax=Phascolarctobacterium succinatutens TaxID=626940 RepID=UPI0026EEC33B